MRAEDGTDWFFHFQDKRAFGRVVHLQPMRWQDDGWPIIGEASAKPGVGQPVAEFAKPATMAAAASVPAPAWPDIGDEFRAKRLAPQWQWVVNPAPGWYSLTERAGFLRLYAQPAPVPANGEAPIAPLRSLPAVLTQKLPAPVFSAVAKLELQAVADGDTVGLAMYGQSYAWLGLHREHGELRIVYVRCEAANDKCKERQEASNALPLKTFTHLRMDVGAGGQTAFSYSQDGVNFTPAGTPFTAAMGRWVGAQVGLFATGAKGAYADIDYLRITP